MPTTQARGLPQCREPAGASSPQSELLSELPAATATVLVSGDASGATELATAATELCGEQPAQPDSGVAAPVSKPAVEAGTHAAGASGHGTTPVLAQAVAALQALVAEGQACGVCQAELKDSDVRLECTALRPYDCLREYHPRCVAERFGHLYRRKELATPQPRDSKWRCMVCSDICAVCAPAARIVANEPFYVCGFCGSKAHQRHWSAGEEKMCFYCHVPM